MMENSTINENMESQTSMDVNEGKIEFNDEKGYEDVIKPILTVKINVNRGPVNMDEFCEMTKQKYGNRVDVIVMPCETDAEAGLTWSYLGQDGDLVTLIKKINEDAELPKHGKKGDLGWDIKATSVEYDEERDRYVYHTGLKVEPPTNIHTLVFPRSSNTKTEAYIPNSVPVIDWNYRGELIIIYKNRTSYKLQCMLAEWEYMKKATEAIEFADGDNIGETMNKMRSNAVEPFKIPDPMGFAPYKAGEHIAQMVFFKEVLMDVTETEDELSETERGDKAWGSSGK